MSTIDEMHLEKPDEPEHQRFDYHGTHRYLVTIPVFGERAAFTDRDLVFSALGILRDTAQQHQFDVFAYCFLPDRLALIVRGKAEESDFRAFLQAFRAASGASYETSRGHALWSKKFQERVLRKEEGTKEAAQQLFMLPVKAGFVRQPQDYAMLGSFVHSVTELLPRPEKAEDVTPRQDGGEEHQTSRQRGEFGRPGSSDRRENFPRPQGDRPGGRRPWGRGPNDRNDRPDGNAYRSSADSGARYGGYERRGGKPGRPGFGGPGAGGPRHGGSRPGGSRPGGPRPGGPRPGGPRPGGPRFGGPRPSGPRFGGSRPGGSRPGGPRFGGPGSGGPRPGGPRPGGSRPGGSRPGGSRPGGPRFGGPRPGGSRPGGPRFGGPRPGGPRRGGPRSGGPRQGGTRS